MTEAALVLQIAQEGFGPNMGLIPLLSDVLSDKSILKAGVGLDQDLGELFRWPNDDGGNMVGRFDLGGIGGSYSSTTSLKNLAKTICGVELPKSRRLATSNWAQSPQLSNEQIAYAARDAWVAAAVLEELSARDKKEFSCENLLQRVLAIELPIDTLVEKAQARKEARAKLQSMLSDGNELLDRKDLTREQLSSVREVEQVIRDLKPPHPLVFDIKPLGFT